MNWEIKVERRYRVQGLFEVVRKLGLIKTKPGLKPHLSEGMT